MKTNIIKRIKFILLQVTALFILSSCNIHIPHVYKIEWLNYDGSVLETNYLIENSFPTYKGNEPIKPKTEKYTYKFNGWSPSLKTVTENTTYTATFSKYVRSYTVTWCNYNGKVLETDTVCYGEMPEYNGVTPEKIIGDSYYYVFAGWNKELSPITEDTTFTAVYKSHDSIKKITWIENDKVFYEAKIEKNDSIPILYNIPESYYDEKYFYQFDKWEIKNDYDSEIILKAKFKIAGSSRNSDNIEYERNGKGYSVKRIASENKNIVIPETFNNLPVISILDNAFIYNNNVETIFIKNGLERLENSCFGGLKKLSNLILPKTLKSIGNDCFLDCSLETLNLPNNIETFGFYCFRLNEFAEYKVCGFSDLYFINDNCLYKKNNGTLYLLSCPSKNNIKTFKPIDETFGINGNAFSNLKIIEEISFPESTVVIDYGAFSNCASLRKITLPNNLRQLGDSCFYRLKQLETIEIATDNKFFKIENNVLYDKTGLILYLYLSTKKDKIFEMPSTVQEIKSHAFNFCNHLENIFLSSNLYRIGKYAFFECSELKEIIIPSTVYLIDDSALIYNEKLKTIIFENPSNWYTFDRNNETKFINSNIQFSYNAYDEIKKYGNKSLRTSSSFSYTGFTIQDFFNKMYVNPKESQSTFNNFYTSIYINELDTDNYFIMNNTQIELVLDMYDQNMKLPEAYYLAIYSFDIKYAKIHDKNNLELSNKQSLIFSESDNLDGIYYSWNNNKCISINKNKILFHDFFISSYAKNNYPKLKSDVEYFFTKEKSDLFMYKFKLCVYVDDSIQYYFNANKGCISGSYYSTNNTI